MDEQQAYLALLRANVAVNAAQLRSLTASLAVYEAAAAFGWGSPEQAAAAAAQAEPGAELAAAYAVSDAASAAWHIAAARPVPAVAR